MDPTFYHFLRRWAAYKIFLFIDFKNLLVKISSITGSQFNYGIHTDFFEQIAKKNWLRFDGVTFGPEDTILTLSTCTYRMADDTKLHYPNDYRYVVMAKLLPADAVLEDTVSLTVTKNAPVNPAGE